LVKSLCVALVGFGVASYGNVKVNRLSGKQAGVPTVDAEHERNRSLLACREQRNGVSRNDLPVNKWADIRLLQFRVRAN
jgi:hypothetical protein